MAYNAASDFITIGGVDYSGILDGDGFSYEPVSPVSDSRTDSGGHKINWISTDRRFNLTLVVNPEAKSALKQLRSYMNSGKSFSLKRDNRNKDGEKVTFLNVHVSNEGSNGKKTDGSRDARTFMLQAERAIIEEGAN